MKIGVDLRIVTLGQTGGLTQWLQGIFEHLIPADPGNEYLVFCTPYNYHLLDIQTPNLRRITLTAERYVSQMRDWLAIEGDVDVLFRCYPYESELDFPARRQVVCVSDSQHEVFPDHFSADLILQRRRVFRYFQTSAGAIGTLTRFTRDELLASAWSSGQDVFLMPPALPRSHGAGPTDPAARASADSEARALLPDAPYFLYPANLWPHKNHRLVLEAFARFHQLLPGTHFVFTGYPDGWDAYQREFGHLPIRHLGYLPPRLLAAVYRRALALAYLSRYEGFGIPLLEAFAAGVPVLCSSAGSLPEVGGDAVLSCDPLDTAAMAQAMRHIAQEKELRQRLVARGRDRLGAYSWEASAEALLAALHRVAGRSGGWAFSSGPPLVSVVTPSYNQGAFVRRTIDSVLGQDYPHIEFRVVDGGSTDGTLDVLRSYAGRFPWISEKDRGQTHAINKGLALAKGQIRTYLNSDDILRPGAVSRVVDHFRRRPACDLVYGRAAFIDADDRFLGMFPTEPYSFDALVQHCCISQPAAFWRDRIAQAVGPFDETLYSVMDYEYWMRIDRAGGRIEYLPEILAGARIHPDAKTSGGLEYCTHRFREMVDTAMKHAGTVSKAFLTHYATTLLTKRYPGILARWPESSLEAAKLWVRYRHVHRCRAIGAFARTVREFAGYLLGQAAITVTTTLWDLSAGRGFASWQTVGRPLRWGRRSPNCLGEEVVIPATLGPARGELRLTGRAPCDGTVSVWVGGAPPCQVPLKANEVADLRLERPADGEREPVILRFTGSLECPLRGEFAFEVLGTNLFEEKDAG